MSFDIQKILGNFPGVPWSRYPNEKHLPGHNFTGANTNLDKRLINNIPTPDSIPINRVDQASMKHDIAYRDHDDKETRHQADKAMIHELDNIQNKTIRERIESALVKKILQTKVKLGMNINELRAVELHRRVKKIQQYRKVRCVKKDHIWIADLMIMPIDNGYKYILVIKDCFTKYTWGIALKNKKLKQ